ncbi:MAG TPA: wax ester/triacylglycerol synthase family O-acyltransferase [Solirubrobacteraceae bacterium]|nr:wax ester/triacylglycerol synthase family O-acyltransferase [Solirubrobacteraceae bacterium]
MSDLGHGERLSAIDASFLQLESGSAHMHVAWSSFLAPPDGAARPGVEALRTRVRARLAWVPRCRQRLLSAPFGLGEPRWVDDAHFDLARHVVQLGDPDEAISYERFAAIRDTLLSTPLDRDRPLWQIALIPRLSDGRAAVVGRVHHAMADGAAALQVAMLMLDVDGSPDAPPAPWQAAPPPTALQRALDPIVHGAELTSRAARDVARACEHPRAAARTALRDVGRMAQALTQDLLPSAPPSSLNGPLGPRRTLVQHRVSLQRLSEITRGTASTRNDAGLAAVAGALRALALEQDVPVEPLKALVPVNVRQAHEYGVLGNRVSMTSIWLPLQLSSPGTRLEHVHEQTARFKRSARSEGTQNVMSGLSLLPSPLRAPVLRAVAPGRFNLTISSVPGPRSALFMQGARLEEIYPVIPMAEEQMLSIGMLAYNGFLHFGLYSDPDALPQATRLAELIDDELYALLRARRSRAPLPVVAPVTAGPVRTYANRSAVLTAAGRGGHA